MGSTSRFSTILRLLTLSGFTTSIPGASALFNVTTPGTAIITISSAGQFSSSAGSITLGDLTASVPDNAPYGSKEILQITNLSVFDDSAIPQPLPSVAQDAIHIAAYFGDTNDDQSYSTPDVTLEQRLIGLINNGFPAFPLADPVLIGDITLNGQIQANDTTSIQRVIGLVNVPNVPALPTGLAPAPSGGPDPTIFIPSEHANPGDTVNVPVEMTVTESAGITVSGFQVAIAYDPTEFTVGSLAQLGSMFSASSGFSGLLTVPKPGELIFQASSPNGTGTIPNKTTTDLFTLSFTVKASAPDGKSVINLLQNIQTTSTAIFDDSLDRLTLSPAPTNGASDSVDGTFSIGTTKIKTVAASASATLSTAIQDSAGPSVNFATAAQPAPLTATSIGPAATVQGSTASSNSLVLRIAKRSTKEGENKGPGGRLHRFETRSHDRRFRELEREVRALWRLGVSWTWQSPS